MESSSSSSKIPVTATNGENHCQQQHQQQLQQLTTELNNIENNSLNDELKLKIPDGAEKLLFQIAGHCFGKSKHKLGLLKHSESGDILKPIFDRRSQREYLFYEQIFSNNNNDECIKCLQKLVPKYNGLFHDKQMNIDYIRLEDITASMQKISLLDIKIGHTTYDPEASEEKRRSEMNKYKYAKQLGFRILGMRYYDHKTNEFIDKNREYGLQITPDNASDALLLFAQNDSEILNEFSEKLKEIEEWFHKYNIKRWKFISSSLLFAYGAINNHNIDNDKRQTVIKMIDFAHVFPNDDQQTDDNYIFGLNKLRYHLELAIELCERKNNLNNCK